MYLLGDVTLVKCKNTSLYSWFNGILRTYSESENIKLLTLAKKTIFDFLHPDGPFLPDATLICKFIGGKSHDLLDLRSFK